ncbi:hypothetical protein BXZ70DRAFT_960558 [Cristinia sonorae]|uniref:Uncharacterized protein n=1 Tax=Cristinia sonorae TaxID=1940300 RepID=A0A8K0UE51_9AGAR|nr:hypothetical protein BXZ70DRAFT_960558 [Cristinia sonorae]
MSQPPPPSGPPPPGAPPAPQFAQIPLPPGLTLDQYLTLQGQIVTIAITVAVAFGIILWDYLTLLPNEIELYKSSSWKLWRSPGTWFFVLLRYAGILATLPSLWFTSVQSDHCQAAVISSQVGAVLAVAASGAIFCFRVFVVWNGNWWVRGVVSLMYCGMLACWISVAAQYKALQGPPTPFGSNCQMQPIVSWAPISYASSVAFDTIVLLLTLAKVHTNLTMVKSAVGRQIYKDNVMYFLITAITNIVVLSIQSLDATHDLIKPTAVPFSTIMTVTMGSRVYLNLKQLDKRREREAEGVPLSTPMISQLTTSSDFTGTRVRDSLYSSYPPRTPMTTRSQSTRYSEKPPVGMQQFGYSHAWPPTTPAVERYIPEAHDDFAK